MIFAQRLKKYDADKSMFKIEKPRVITTNDYPVVVNHALILWILALICYIGFRLYETAQLEWFSPDFPVLESKLSEDFVFGNLK